MTRARSSRSRRLAAQVERDDRKLAEICFGQRKLDPRRVIGETARRELVLVSLEQFREVGPGLSAAAKPGRPDAAQAQFLEGVGERAREAGKCATGRR